MADAVLFETEGAIAIITINRPEAKNAVNGAVARGMADGLAELDRRNDLSLGIVTGAGGTFCAGMDLKAFLSGDMPFLDNTGFAGITERTLEKPLIAAVEGYALAGGFEIVLSCDLVVAASDAKFGIPEVTRGLVAGAGGLLRLPRRIPYHAAMEMALTGDHYPARQLAAWGLVSRLAEPGQALAAATELAGKISANAPLSLAASKRVITESQDWSRTEAFANQAEIIRPVLTSKDAMEGAAAFAEKRKPQWRGE